MNISFLLGDATAKGGIEKVTFTLASALNKYHKVNLISLYKMNSEPVFSLNSLPLIYLVNHTETSMYNRPFKGGVGYFFDLCYIIKKSISLKSVLKKRNAEVIVTSDIKMTLLVWLASLLTHHKIIAIEHFEYEVSHPILKKLRKILYKKIAGVVTLTNEDCQKYFWLPKRQHHIIPNIVHITIPPNEVSKTNNVIAVGRLTPQKGFDLLIKAWERISREHPDWTLKIVGEGEEKEKLERLIEEYEITSISLLPFTKDIDSIYQQSKLFVLSSRYEGLGMVLIEALAHKLPCVSFDCPAGPKTIIKNGINGLLVPTGDVTKLTEAIKTLLVDEELRAKFSANALESIYSFTEECVTERWNAMIKGLSNER